MSVELSMRQFQEFCEDLLIERATMLDVLVRFYGWSPQRIEKKYLMAAKMDPEMRALARQEFVKMWNDLEHVLGVESHKARPKPLEPEEPMKVPPKGGKPN